VIPGTSGGDLIALRSMGIPWKFLHEMAGDKPNRDVDLVSENMFTIRLDGSG
jgi:hypothetical protein